MDTSEQDDVRVADREYRLGPPGGDAHGTVAHASDGATRGSTHTTVPRQAPLAFVYDRNATRSHRLLDMRLDGCRNYAAEQGWEVAGRWFDRGDDAIGDVRPQFTALLAAMSDAVRDREVICLVHSWGRFSHDATARTTYEQRVARTGGHTETTFGESDAYVREALAGRWRT
ncbi:recombinase family protein [Streptomyces sp. MST-110588]|uniref:recombinase family protein n=1 Tax=Streptomyces sp. MST-110588 TaxID=2833628 RepID=UPI001F5D54DA|nr:recombinase family protein [Streptomyces sp. MST-110588]UNO42213.1 recombinase family protein [Streptomyces sp. MST-110588]